MARTHIIVPADSSGMNEAGNGNAAGSNSNTIIYDCLKSPGIDSRVRQSVIGFFQSGISY